MDLKGLHYVDQDKASGKWFVVFDGVKLNRRFHLEEGAMLFLDQLLKVSSFRPKRGRPRKNHVKINPTTREWAVYVNNKFICFKPTELEAIDHMLYLTSPEVV